MSWHRTKKTKEPEVYPSVLEGVKRIYATKIRPLEESTQFGLFHSPVLRDSDFDAKPQVLLLGQYSTGKTTFIKYLLESSFPGAHIGPEPTTDRFLAVYHGTSELNVPGNALCVQADRPFRGLEKFGNDFLSKFQGAQLPNPVLEDITFIDTPGVLSGEKQRVGRQYEFTAVTEWFAERSDMILLLFDAHKLDISDEFKRAIESLRGNDDKIRVVLNKSDLITHQQLMRVYGALMWSLGKVLQTPEVVRVYISSFPYDDKADAPGAYQEISRDNHDLFDKEKDDLLTDLYSLPRYAAIRKVNDLVKRARLAKTHAYILSTIREKMPAVFGKQKKKDEIITNLKDTFFEVHKRYGCPVGDFPNLRRMQSRLAHCDFSKFPKLNEKFIAAMDEVLSNDIPQLLKQFPQEQSVPVNPFESSNPFDGDLDAGAGAAAAAAPAGPISQDDRIRWANTFNSLHPAEGRISGGKAKPVMVESGLQRDQLSAIWNLSDHDGDGHLTLDEFIVCAWLLRHISQGNPLPTSWDDIPPEVRGQAAPVVDTVGDPFAADVGNAGAPPASAAAAAAAPAPGAAAAGAAAAAPVLQDTGASDFGAAPADLWPE